MGPKISAEKPIGSSESSRKQLSIDLPPNSTRFLADIEDDDLPPEIDYKARTQNITAARDYPECLKVGLKTGSQTGS